jgi:hypothetical protein
MLVLRHTDPVTRVMAHTDPVMLVLRHTDPVTRVMAQTGPVMLVLQHTDPVTRVMAHTGPVMPVPLAMSPPQAPSRSRLAIGRIILVVRVITWAALITYGGRDIGDGAADKESGYTGIMS